MDFLVSEVEQQHICKLKKRVIYCYIFLKVEVVCASHLRKTSKS